jgi:hypothetical protein
MTTIAWDGKTLAGDKRANLDGIRMTVTKVRRGRAGNLVGYFGPFAAAEEVFSHLCDGGPRPLCLDDPNSNVGVLEIDPEGRVWIHETGGCYRIEDPFYAAGTGQDFALMAMRLGQSAAEAVRLTADFDIRTGNGVDVLTRNAAPVRPARSPAVSSLRAPRGSRRPAAAASSRKTRA